MSKLYDIVVVGGGIVGCAAGREILKRFPSLRLAVLEKERDFAMHQSGNNSGVIHAGIYYVPGSLKAKLCVRGLELSYKYFDERNIPYKKCGKALHDTFANRKFYGATSAKTAKWYGSRQLIVAVEERELPNLMALHERGLQNAVRDLELIEALWSPHTGIVDWGLVTKEYAKEIKECGGDLECSAPVAGFRLLPESSKSGTENTYPLAINVKGKDDIRCKFVITCAGLHSDRVAKLSGCSPVPKIVPFRGEYLLLKPEKRHLVRGNIYPVPDPRFPFLGVHFTPRMNDDVWLGPNAVLAYSREGYSYFNINPKDVLESLMFRGMRKLMMKYTAAGLDEFKRSLFIGGQVKLLQRYIPELSMSDVVRGPAGVRAQALDAEGNLVDDFVFDQGTGDIASRLLHVRNAPSPGATSSLAIAEMVADEAQRLFNL